MRMVLLLLAWLSFLVNVCTEIYLNREAPREEL
jgi:hypothetical protein